jgi:hypothetical protein
MVSQTSSVLAEIITTEQRFVKELQWIAESFCEQTPEGLTAEVCADMTPGVMAMIKESTELTQSLQTSMQSYTRPSDHYETLANIGDDFLKFLRA